MSYTIRSLIPDDAAIHREMMYQALFVVPGDPPFPRDILDRPDLAKYSENWGQPGDLGFVAMDDETGVPVGAAWLRLVRGYGYVDDQTPELSIALLPEHRSKGVGSQLMEHILEAAKAQFPGVSLSVSSKNQARFLYQKIGFEIVNRDENSLTMVKRFS